MITPCMPARLVHSSHRIMRVVVGDDVYNCSIIIVPAGSCSCSWCRRWSRSSAFVVSITLLCCRSCVVSSKSLHFQENKPITVSAHSLPLLFLLLFPSLPWHVFVDAHCRSCDCVVSVPRQRCFELRCDVAEVSACRWAWECGGGCMGVVEGRGWWGMVRNGCRWWWHWWCCSDNVMSWIPIPTPTETRTCAHGYRLPVGASGCGWAHFYPWVTHDEH